MNDWYFILRSLELFHVESCEGHAPVWMSFLCFSGMFDLIKVKLHSSNKDVHFVLREISITIFVHDAFG